MKSMIFVCVALVVMAGIARVYMAGGIEGLWNLDVGSTASAPKLPENIDAVTTDQDVEIFKWVDENGVVHFGQQPPDLSGTAERITLKRNQNIIDPVRQQEQEQDPVAVSEPVVPTGTVTANPYSPEGVQQIMTQTRALQDALNKQQEQKDEMLRGLVPR